MDIQQNQQEQNKQGQQCNPANRIKSISSLGAITKYAINALTEKAPSYFYVHEKGLTDGIRDYGIELIQGCKDGTLLDLPDEAIEEFIENSIDDVLNASCAMSHEYFKAGVQFGALLTAQLLI